MYAYKMQKTATSGAAWQKATCHQPLGCAHTELNHLLSHQHFAGQIHEMPSLYREEEGFPVPYSFASPTVSQLGYTSPNEQLPRGKHATVGFPELEAVYEKASATSGKKAETPTDSASEARAWREFCLLTVQWACNTSSTAQNESWTQQLEEMRDCASLLSPLDARPNSVSLPVFRPPPGLEDGPWPQTTQESFLKTEYGFAGTDSRADNETVDAIEKGDAALKHEQASSTKPGVDSELGETLRKHLQELQHEDPSVVIIVRKISKLGFQSQELLRNHFEEYGDISKILIAHSFVKPSNRRVKPRVRPAGLGFVVMSSRSDADAVLCLGENQTIAGVPVQVLPYAQPQQST